jgi:hypothetical protein
VWRSDDRGDSWTPVSGDLTRTNETVCSCRRWAAWSFDAPWDLYAMSRYNTITSLPSRRWSKACSMPAPTTACIQVSEDGGASWRAIDSLPGVPNRFFVNDIKADLHDADTVYVVVDNHKSGDFSPYILKSETAGAPGRASPATCRNGTSCGASCRITSNRGCCSLGTEFGVFFTVDGGERWTKLDGGAPTIAFRDLAIQTRENDLVGATFGRGSTSSTITRRCARSAEAISQREALLFPVRDALWYLPELTLGDFSEGGKASQGDAFFVAPNPPFGAVFTYYLDLHRIPGQPPERRADRIGAAAVLHRETAARSRPARRDPRGADRVHPASRCHEPAGQRCGDRALSLPAGNRCGETDPAPFQCAGSHCASRPGNWNSNCSTSSGGCPRRRNATGTAIPGPSPWSGAWMSPRWAPSARLTARRRRTAARWKSPSRPSPRLRGRLNEIGTRELPELRAALNAAGVPWTPGRAVPATD